MNFDAELLKWVEFLSGFTAERVESAVKCLKGWALPHVEAELTESTVDNALAATLLVESVRYLVSVGIDEARLLKKLRSDRDVWPTYAEIRAAKILAAPFGKQADFALEPRCASGRHADFRTRLITEPDPVFVEFKAIGLSDDETAFCHRMAPQLPELLPPMEYVAFHGQVDSRPFTIRPDRRGDVAAAAAACAA